jgi:threonylcarbamoyladenosine tRNA methylthiotransferase MtaB
MRIAFTTLGCKINQVETDVLRQDLEARGNAIVPFSADADVYIINTCSVTAKSDYQCRQAIRSAVRRGQRATVVVTGCYAELNPGEIKKIAGVDHIVGTRDKDKIPDIVSHMHSSLSRSGEPKADSNAVEIVRKRTRGFLKIQDGCDNRCSYCIVPFARGRSRSVSFQEVLRVFERMVHDGCPEIVLTGIHIGTYGSDLGTGTSLTKLLRTLLASRGGARIRLSSIEPQEITQELISLLGTGLCRHLHIPLQSGDDTILASMKRNYTSSFYRSLLDRIAGQSPDIALGADVMVGFPGEGEREFQNTVRLVEQAPLTHLHVFSYSPRPGTLAMDMNGQVPDRVKKTRSEVLRNLAQEKNGRFNKRHIGSELEAVVLDKHDGQTGFLTGLTDNYITAHISKAKKEHIGKIVRIIMKEMNNGESYAEIL